MSNESLLKKYSKNKQYDYWTHPNNRVGMAIILEEIRKKEELLELEQKQKKERRERARLLLEENNVNNNVNNVNNVNNDDNNVSISAHLRVKILNEEYMSFSNVFYYSQTNPEILITKPLLLDVTVSATRTMIQSYNRLRKAMEELSLEENIDDLEFILEKAKRDFNTADNHATIIGIPGNKDRHIRLARKSFEIVINDASTKEEKKTHWNKILKIVREAGIKESAISVINSTTLGYIENGTLGKLRELENVEINYQ